MVLERHKAHDTQYALLNRPVEMKKNVRVRGGGGGFGMGWYGGLAVYCKMSITTANCNYLESLLKVTGGLEFICSF